MSANNVVTALLSPSRFLEAEVSAMRIGPLLAFFADGAEGVPRWAAHSFTGRSPCRSHSNRRIADISVRTERPISRKSCEFHGCQLPLYATHRYALSSSHRILASLRSTESKPSVNQP